MQRRHEEGKLEFDVFLCHARGKDSRGRDNHARVVSIGNALKKRGQKVWVDDSNIMDAIDKAACDGIDKSKVVLLFITTALLNKVAGSAMGDYVMLEFNYAKKRKTAEYMLCVVMEPECLDTSAWTGPVGMHLADHLYCDFTDDTNFESRLDDLMRRIQDKARPKLSAAPADRAAGGANKVEQPPPLYTGMIQRAAEAKAEAEAEAKRQEEKKAALAAAAAAEEASRVIVSTKYTN